MEQKFQRFNYHTHTNRCGHADMNMSDEDFVIELIKKGFYKIAFTDHCPEKEMIDTRTRMRMSYQEKENYLNSIEMLKEKYKDKIQIESGFEVEYLPGQENNLWELKKATDKMILGQHFIYDDAQQKLLYFRKHDFTDKELRRYAEYITLALANHIPDIIAHPDIYMLNRTAFGDIEKEVANLICASAETYGVPLEINLTQPVMYLTKKLNEITYPCREFWEVASNYKVKVLFGIDAHWRDQIENYEKAVLFTEEYIGQQYIKKLHFCNDELK